ncbi:hypothetical protein [Spirillospora sp. NBC_01491]|uniref:hypothetical protein n=1 Tax=Spirillospora sp. NBC_01491 TaxID=2976007 RepID=UPI002E3417DC|nr:hypothetical protein [Spirillospora sp. NBC_01491]
MKVRRSLAIATPLVAMAAGVPAYTYLGTDNVHNAAPSAAAAPSLGDFALKKGSDRAAPLKAMNKALKKSSVTALLNASGQRKLGSGCGGKAGVPAKSLVYCFNKEDSTTKKWVPQGVTSSSDATADEAWGANKPMMVVWYADKAIRLTFVNPAKKTYRHVLLTYPKLKGKSANYTDIDLHAGGVAWFGNYVYVADTVHGLRVFDVTKIFDLGKSKNGTTKKKGLVGLHGKTYYGHGYRYVMPQVGSWQHKNGDAPLTKCKGSGPPRTSWVSVDRTARQQPKLITGEYCATASPKGRVATWPMKVGTGLVSSGGVAKADWAAPLPDKKIQGGVRSHDFWWFTHNVDTAGGAKRGQLLVTSWNAQKKGWGGVQRRTISYGPEDLSCFRGQRRVWTVAEHAGKRALWGTLEEPCNTN